MYPGWDCNNCHRSNGEGPMFSIDGTVMPGVHEADGCGGTAGATVRITDANGVVHELGTTQTGNFYTTARIATPYTATVSYGGRELAMVTPQSDGDCNSCHSVEGTGGAPGRIYEP